jgi:hypothetical protein
MAGTTKLPLHVLDAATVVFLDRRRVGRDPRMKRSEVSGEGPLTLLRFVRGSS